MGHEHSKSKKKSHPPQIDSNKLNFTLKQIYFTAQLYRDRRKGQQSVREKELLSLFREPANKRVRDNEYQKAAAIVNDIKWIKAFELLMRYADLLKDNETVIQMSKGNTANINELIPYVESVIWGCQKGSIECINAFNTYIYSTFGPEAYNQLCTFTKVTPELKECFVNVLPSEREVKLYLIEFCNKNGISMDSMNEIGHGLSLSALADFPSPNDQLQGPPLTTTIQTNQQIQPPVYPTYPGNFQQGYPQGGFPNNNFPQGPTNFPQGSGSSPGGFSQGGYPQGGFPQGGSNSGGFSQGGYPQYPQGDFPQGGQQGGFAQGGQSLGGSYAQRGVNYPSFSNYPPSNFNANPLEPYKQAPVSGTQGLANKENLNMNAGGREMSFGQPTQQEKSGSGSGIGGYPDFQKFGGNVPGGQVGGADPLDELDMRLRNIKGGL